MKEEQKMARISIALTICRASKKHKQHQHSYMYEVAWPCTISAVACAPNSHMFDNQKKIENYNLAEDMENVMPAKMGAGRR